MRRVLAALALSTCLTLAALAVPAAPSGLRGVVTSSTTISLVFDDNSTTPNEETNFEFSINGSPLSVGGHAGTGTISLGLSPFTANTTYTIAVRAYITTTANASAFSNTIAVTTADFNAPNSVAAVTQASGAVLVTWTDNAVSEAGYFVEYATAAAGPFTSAGATTANFTGFNVSGLAPATTYYFRLRGFKGTAASPTALTAFSAVVSAATPAIFAAPTGLTATTTGERAVLLAFTDNSANNTGYEIWLQPAGGSSFSYVGDAGDVVSINTGNILAPGNGYDFAVRAYYQNGANPRVYSAFSNVASAVTPFNAPTGLTVTPTSETAVLLAYADNSSANTGYEIWSQPTGGVSFTHLSDAGDGTSSNTGNILLPGVSYDFAVRAYFQSGANPRVYSDFTNIVSATTPFNAPTSLTAASASESAVLLAYADNSAVNTGYEILLRLTGGSSFLHLGDAGDVASYNTGSILLPGRSYDFAVRAYYQNGANSRLYSALSNVTSAVTPFNGPTNLTVTPSATSPYLISFAWADNSSEEGGYELEYRQQGAASFSSRKIVVANVTGVANLPEFLPGTVYEFRIHALSGSVSSAYFPAAGGVVATTRNGFGSKPYAPIQVGTFFSYQMATISQSARTSWSVGVLPPGLSFDSASGVISGTPTTAGVYTVTMTANFASGPAHVLPLMLRVLTPPAAPQITAVIGAQTLTQGGASTIALGTKFADPDTESAVRMVTTKGNVDIALYAATTPLTVANFNSYNYTDVLFHRAPANFVVQGGGFKTYAAPNVFEHLATAAAVANEPGISNTVGTVAMAKVGDDPNSATSEFFFNVNDNSANLDNQNGGFTVFGRVAVPSLNSTLFALATAPVANYPVQLHTGPGATDYTASTFTDLPIDQLPLPAAVDQSRLVKVMSVTALPVLTYAVQVNTNPSIASATLAGGSLQLTALAPGVTTLIVRATDVDGNTRSQTFTVTVQQTFAQWAAANGTTPGATDNPDQDALTNLQEWAFFGNPGVPDGAAHLPTFALTPGAGARFVEITFPVRKFTANLTYSVEASSTLANDWTTIWTSTQGFAVPAVTAAVNQSDRTVVTVRDTVSTSATARRFLRAKVQ